MIRQADAGAKVVPILGGWDAVHATASMALDPWRGIVWRSHGIDLTASRRAGVRIFYDAISDGGSRRKSGRYHRAADYFPSGRVWPALYTSLTDGGCIAEAVRHAGSLASLDVLRMTRIQVNLSAVLDLTDPTSYGLTLDDVIGDHDYEVTQELGLAALDKGAEGILVPPASRVGTNLVILTENLRTISSIVALDSIDPRLYVPRA
jgi:RES domain-containing protein